MPAGRPTDYSKELVSLICSRLVEGESLRSICRDPTMPSLSSVFLWLQIHAEFSEQYTRARDAQSDTYADEIIDIADTPQIGETIIKKADGTTETRKGDMVQHRHLRIEARKWIASKLKPKKYGQNLGLSAPGGGPIVISKSDADL